MIHKTRSGTLYKNANYFWLAIIASIHARSTNHLDLLGNNRTTCLPEEPNLGSISGMHF